MLQDKYGNPQTSIDAIKSMVTDFYVNLFTTYRALIMIDQLDMDDNRLDEGMVADLIKPYSREEIVLALKDMHPCKSPRPDGQMGYPLCSTSDTGILLEMIYVLWL